jgi:hypothetical protein
MKDSRFCEMIWQIFSFLSVLLSKNPKKIKKGWGNYGFMSQALYNKNIYLYIPVKFGNWMRAPISQVVKQ